MLSYLSQRRDLNPRPLPYQGSALPLSYTGLTAENRAGEEARTLDPQLGRLMLYQLSYSRFYLFLVRYSMLRFQPELLS